MKQSIFPLDSASCRTPFFPLDQELEAAWPKLKILIAQSSLEFYERIHNLSYQELLQQKPNIRFTVWKYFNRSKYRATPFGSLAGISVVPLDSKISRNEVTVHSEMESYAVRREKTNQNLPLISQLEKKRYLSNSTWYQIGNEIRFLILEQNKYCLSSIPFSIDILELLEFCSSIKNYQEIISFLHDAQKLIEKHAKAVLKDLVIAEIIVAESNSSVTGKYLLDRVPLHIENSKSCNYIISSRKVVEGGLSPGSLKEVQQYINFLKESLPNPANKDLQDFKDKFAKRWENRAIPLSIVLDPFNGIPYGRNKLGVDESLIGILAHDTVENSDQSSKSTEIERFLYREIIKGDIIKLENYNLKSADGNKDFPNTFSALIYFYEGNPVIKNVGGYSACSMAGRFTILPTLRDHVKKIAQIEENSNHEVIFFDLAYPSEEKKDFVNWRQHIYQTELPFVSWSSKRHLRFQDIMISIERDLILLHHAHTGKRLIPRFPSAYNYHRSDLPYFRFLYDLQGQEAMSLPQIDLKSIVPGLNHYPRLVFKNCIISPERWKCPSFDSQTELSDWLINFGPKGNFLVGNSDQTLLIDPTKIEDIQHFFSYCKKNKNPIIEESFLSHSSIIKDQFGKKYFGEFVVDFFHTRNVYEKIALSTKKTYQNDLKSFNSDWIYIEFYMNENVSDMFIMNGLAGFISSSGESILSWFFIRYNDPSFHIRLRIRKRPNIENLFSKIGEYFSPLRENGAFVEMRIREYEREICRYGREAMSSVEKFFHMDSKLAVKDIAFPTIEKYSKILTYIECLSSTIIPDNKDRKHFYRDMAAVFAKEMNFDKNSYRKINDYSTGVKMNSCTTRFKTMINQFRIILLKTAFNDRLKLLSDLIHLHINRRFRSDQRIHEAILYQIAYRFLVREIRLKR